MYKAIGYFDEMDKVVIREMTTYMLDYCDISGFQVIYVKNY